MEKVVPQDRDPAQALLRAGGQEGAAGGRQRLRLARRDDAAQSAVRRSDLPPASSAGRAQDSRTAQSLGSGVIVDPSGLVVTNHHVIEGMTEVKVALSDRREFEAEIVLRDPRTDLAVLKIKSDETFPGAGARRFRRDRGRRFRHRDRQSVRRRADGDAGHRLGAGAHADRHQRLRLLHPDRRRDQSRQFRRRAGRSLRAARRHQFGDLFALGRQHGDRLRDPRQHGQERRSRRRGAAARRSSAPGSAPTCRTSPRTSPIRSASTGRPARSSSASRRARPRRRPG